VLTKHPRTRNITPLPPFAPPSPDPLPPTRPPRTFPSPFLWMSHTTPFFSQHPLWFRLSVVRVTKGVVFFPPLFAPLSQPIFLLKGAVTLKHIAAPPAALPDHPTLFLIFSIVVVSRGSIEIESVSRYFSRDPFLVPPLDLASCWVQPDFSLFFSYSLDLSFPPPTLSTPPRSPLVKRQFCRLSVLRLSQEKTTPPHPFFAPYPRLSDPLLRQITASCAFSFLRWVLLFFSTANPTSFLLPLFFPSCGSMTKFLPGIVFLLN